MENIYENEEDKHLNYIIVNRSAKFNVDTCLRLNETKGNITKVSKETIDKISMPFRSLREGMQNDIQRSELEKEIMRIKKENLDRSNELRRIKIKENSGYVAMGALIVVGTLFMAALIFTVTLNLLR